MILPDRSADKNFHIGPCVACGASLAGRPSTVTVIVRHGSARETTWTSCRCGAISKSERVRRVTYAQSRMPDATHKH